MNFEWKDFQYDKIVFLLHFAQNQSLVQQNI